MMSQLNPTTKKRKRRRKTLSVRALAEKYIPLEESEEAADRPAAEKRPLGGDVLSGKAVPEYFLPPSNPWEPASRLALVRVLRHAIAEEDIEAVKWYILEVLDRLKVVVPEEIRAAVFKPWPRGGRAGRPVRDETREVYTTWLRMGQPSMKSIHELAEALYGTGFSEADSAKQKAILRKLQKVILRRLKAEVRELEASVAEAERPRVQRRTQGGP